MNQAIERFLDLVGAGIELIEKQAIGLFASDHAWWAEAAFAVDDLWHADQIFGRKLTAKQRNAGETDSRRKLLDQGRLTDPRLPPDKDWAYHRDVKQDIAKLFLCDSDCWIQC